MQGKGDSKGAEMTVHEREMVTSLCARINDEKDPYVFTELVIELEALLETLPFQPPASVIS